LQWDPGAKSKPICKSSSRHKSVHHNIDDTDSKDDAGGCEATDALSNRWKDKWKSYLNTNEDVPEGVREPSLQLGSLFASNTIRSMATLSKLCNVSRPYFSKTSL
jgi:hypothetical protein